MTRKPPYELGAFSCGNRQQNFFPLGHWHNWELTIVHQSRESANDHENCACYRFANERSNDESESHSSEHLFYLSHYFTFILVIHFCLLSNSSSWIFIGLANRLVAPGWWHKIVFRSDSYLFSAPQRIRSSSPFRDNSCSNNWFIGHFPWSYADRISQPGNPIGSDMNVLWVRY